MEINLPFDPKAGREVLALEIWVQFLAPQPVKLAEESQGSLVAWEPVYYFCNYFNLFGRVPGNKITHLKMTLFLYFVH